MVFSCLARCILLCGFVGHRLCYFDLVFWVWLLGCKVGVVDYLLFLLSFQNHQPLSIEGGVYLGVGANEFVNIVYYPFDLVFLAVPPVMSKA